jgi:hypothetical protein
LHAARWLTLRCGAPGTYELSVEAFARNGGTLTISCDALEQDALSQVLDAVVYKPSVNAFELPYDAS